MRKITQNAVDAFIAGRTFNGSNTTVSTAHLIDGFNVSMYLHGNLIAERTGSSMRIRDAGWQSNTTKERLNGLLDTLALPRIYQKDFAWYIGDGETWTGERELVWLDACRIAEFK